MWVLLWLGCGPHCGPWSELPITGAELDSERLEAVRSGIDTMAEWTQREEICLEQIQMVEGLTSKENGLPINGSVGVDTIRLRAEMDAETMARVTRHELCHAIDREMGWPSAEAGGALDERAADIGDLHYPEHHNKLREAFADICESGPKTTDLFALAATDCAPLALDEAGGFVEEQLFTQVLDVPMATHTWEIDDTPLTLQEHHWNTLPLGDGLLFINRVYDEETEELTHSLALYTLSQGKVTDEVSLPVSLVPAELANRDTLWTHSPLDSNDGVVLLGRRGESSWRVRSEGGQLVLKQIQAPELGTVPYGRETGGRFLFYDRGAAWVHIEGQTRQITFHTESGEPAELQGFRLAQDGALLTWESSSGSAVQLVDHKGEQIWRQSIPFEGTWVYRAQEGLDGQVLVALGSRHEWRNVGLSLNLDPQTGRWSRPVGDHCMYGDSWWTLIDEQLVTIGWDFGEAPGEVSLRTGRY